MNPNEHLQRAVEMLEYTLDLPREATAACGRRAECGRRAKDEEFRARFWGGCGEVLNPNAREWGYLYVVLMGLTQVKLGELQWAEALALVRKTMDLVTTPPEDQSAWFLSDLPLGMMLKDVEVAVLEGWVTDLGGGK